MKRIRLGFTVSLLLLIIGCRSSQPPVAVQQHSAAPLFSVPDSIALITSDIDRFWEMFDRESPLFTKWEIDTQYIDAGTPALSGFYDYKIKSSDAFSSLLNNRFDRAYYQKVRSNTLAFAARRDSIINALQKLKRHYPDAVFTDITFIIGNLNTSGVLLPDNRIVIAAEMFSRQPRMKLSNMSPWHQSAMKSIDYVPVVVLHETVHLQQSQFSPDSSRSPTLLERSLAEGSAEFVTRLLLGKTLRDDTIAYGDSHEALLWNQFQNVMDQKDYRRWLYNGNSGPHDRPPDLGYYIGFTICRYYYEHHSDKEQALGEIIEMRNPHAFLKKSGYINAMN